MLSHIFYYQDGIFYPPIKDSYPIFNFSYVTKIAFFLFFFANFDQKIWFQPKNYLYFLILQKTQIQHVPSNTHGETL